MVTRRVIGNLLKENGVVVRRHGEKRLAFWVQCQTCGAKPPLLEDGWPITHGTSSFFSQLLIACEGCGQDGPYRQAITPKDGAKPHTKCNRRCTEGKYICNCRCQGRCHGEGTCYCKEESDGNTEGI